MFVPQIEGGSTPVWPAAAKESEQRPAVVEVANPDIVWKSSRNCGGVGGDGGPAGGGVDHAADPEPGRAVAVCTPALPDRTVTSQTGLESAGNALHAKPLMLM